MNTDEDKKVKYKRVIIKLSGEILRGEGKEKINKEKLFHYAREIKSVKELGVQIGVILGGGNFIRGEDAQNLDIDSIQADYMGMVATILNGMALQSALEKLNVSTRLMSAIRIEQVAEPYIRRRAIRHLEKGRIVIFVGGTGNPNFTTDTTAALRAAEIQAEVILKGTKVDGVFSADPLKNSNAVKYDTITFKEAYEKNLKIMDLTAFTICKEHNLKVIIFDINKSGNLKRIILGENIGTMVY